MISRLQAEWRSLATRPAALAVARTWTFLGLVEPGLLESLDDVLLATGFRPAADRGTGRRRRSEPDGDGGVGRRGGEPGSVHAGDGGLAGPARIDSAEAVDPARSDPDGVVDPARGDQAEVVDPACGDQAEVAGPESDDPDRAAKSARCGPDLAAKPTRSDPAEVAGPERDDPDRATKPASGDPDRATKPASGDPGRASEPASGDPDRATKPASGDPGPATGPARGDPDEVADAVLLALVAEARIDGLAARVVLQRLVPGLAAIARRRGPTMDEHLRAFDELLAAAWTVIRGFPVERRRRHVAASLLRDCEYHAFRRDRRRKLVHDYSQYDHLAGLVDDDDVSEPMLEVLDVIAAARDHHLADGDMSLLRVLLSGQPLHDAAAAIGVSERTVRNRRSELVHRLRAAMAA